MWMKHNQLNEHEQMLLDMSGAEFEIYMIENYTEMFQQIPVQEGQKLIHPMNFGFDIGPGWRHVLDSLCQQLKLVQDLTGVVCIFDQIKEKYGGAEFYNHPSTYYDGNEVSVEKEELRPLGSTQSKTLSIPNDNDQKAAILIIENLVNHHTEYCDYICEVLGTNVRPNEKIVIGRWYYGCGLDGFIKSHKDEPKLIEEAKRFMDKMNRIKDIKNELYALPSEKLEEIEKIITHKEQNA